MRRTSLFIITDTPHQWGFGWGFSSYEIINTELVFDVKSLREIQLRGGIANSLSLSLSPSLSLWMCICLSVCLSIYLSVYLFVSAEVCGKMCEVADISESPAGATALATPPPEMLCSIRCANFDEWLPAHLLAHAHTRSSPSSTTGGTILAHQKQICRRQRFDAGHNGAACINRL